jgi:hypothetical protein
VRPTQIAAAPNWDRQRAAEGVSQISSLYQSQLTLAFEARELGSIGKFYPYGVERPSATTNGTEKFTGYFRDSESGNDYAVNRYEPRGTEDS